MAELRHTQTFNAGIDTTTAPEFKANTTAEYILNCNSLSTAEGNVGIITNVKGNVKIPVSLPDGDNVTIGYAKDQERSNLYYFVWNSNDLHTIYRFNDLDRTIIPVIQNLTDTGGIDTLNLNEEFILHADVVRGDLLYWTQKNNKARKTNIKKCLDKTASGYGPIIREEFINAYKPTSTFAPVAEYFSDETKSFNRMYGKLFKFISRFIYQDGEKSNWSDYSNVPLPLGEPMDGIAAIPTNNNAINVTVETGSPDVKLIEIGMQSTDPGTLNGISPFYTIAVLNKINLSIDNDSTYTYTWYNNQAPIHTDQEKVIRPYSFLPRNPLCQSFVNNALVYSNFKEGFSDVDVNATIGIDYEDLTISDGVVNEFNEPLFERTYHEVFYVRGSGGNRETAEAYTVGNDVKKGNIFTLSMSVPSSSPGGLPINISASWTYKATAFDTAVSVANYFRTKIYEWTPEKKYLTDVEVDFDGNASFSFRIRWYEYADGSSSVIPIQFNSLKDTGESKNNIKLGSSLKFAYEYSDDDGRKSLAYTNDEQIADISPINTFGEFKKPVITINIKHRPPVWAKYYQIVRTKDLIYDQYIQMLIQDVVPVDAPNATGEYIDLVVGSLSTYKKLHDNSVLTYAFDKGDRIRLIKWYDPDTFDETYYDFYETEIISYMDTVDTVKSEIIETVEDSATVTVPSGVSEDNVGKVILIDGVERTIQAAPTGTTYTLDNPMPETKKYAAYNIIDRRGTVRIRKPSEDVIEEIKDLSVVELYKPSSNGSEDSSKTFYEFGNKFPVLNWGTETRAHGGVTQNQDGTSATTLISTPAIIKIDNGTSYVRNREMPITSSISGTFVISAIEDAGYSDFYNSQLNNNGRVTIEDTGDGEVDFGSRCRFSNNFIEDTRINGLNDFDNLDREDYNDQYGNIMRTYFHEKRLYAFKELKDTWIPVSQNILTQADGTPVVGLSSKLLNNMQYFAWEGGIGNNPESLASNATYIYHVSTNSGVVVRIGGDGITPVSETYHVDNTVRSLFADASKNGAKIIGEVDRITGAYFFSILNYTRYVFNSNFNSSAWNLYNPEVPITTQFEVVVAPLHGDVDFNDTTYQFVYTSDTGYVGSDNFTYRAFVGGVWSNPRKVCLTITEPANRVKAWRGKPGTEFCVIGEDDLRTGYRGWNTLQEYYTDDNTATGVEKTNVVTDANYLAPIQDLVNCNTYTITVTNFLSTSTDPETGDVTFLITFLFSDAAPSNVTVDYGYTYTVDGGAPIVGTGSILTDDTIEVVIDQYPPGTVIGFVDSEITNITPDPVDGVDII